MDSRRSAVDFERAPNQLADILHGCLFGETTWQYFLDRLNDTLPGGRSLLMVHDGAAGMGRFALSSQLSDDDIRIYNQHYSHVNPWMKRAAVRPVGLGVISEQMLPYADLIKTEYYNDYMKRIACEGGVGITVMRERSRSTIVTTMTSRADPDANLAAANLLTRLFPDLRRVLNITRSHLTEMENEQLAIFDAIGIGTILIGSDCTVKQSNAAGQAILGKAEICSVTPSGRFYLRHTAANASLMQMLGILATKPGHFSCTVDTVQGPAKITLTRLYRDKATDFWGGPTVAVIFEQRRQTPPEPLLLSQRYKLTAAETRLTNSLLDGKSLKDSAETFGVTEGTARQQLKSIFHKVGVSRQSELIRIVGLALGGLI